MKTTLDYISELQAEVEAVQTQGSKLSREKLISYLNEGRALAISNSGQGGTRINPVWLQTYYCVYDSLLQDDDCNVIFDLPSAIKFKKYADGYVGFFNNDGSVQYRRFNTLGEVNNAMNHPILARSLTKYIAVLVENEQAKIYTKVPRARLQQLRVSGLFNNPTELPDFNITTDQYPIDETTFEWVRGWLKQTILNQIEQTPVTGEKTSANYAVPQRRR